MEIPTTTLQTPCGKEVEMKTYITAGERNKLRAVFLEHAKIDPQQGGKIESIGGEVLEKAEHALIQIALVSYDASPERILDRLLDATPEEYDFVVQQANKLEKLGFQRAK